ncbi:MAG: GGDEF domain-containing protein, partial [Nitrospirae bacterium]|nr:GGDEF domain-containing protein [Nitrospirota bacterium]
AQCIRGSLRTIDVVSRFGGDEFTILLPETKREGAIVIAERIRQEVARTYLPHAEVPGGRALTVSIGLSSYPTDADSADALVRRTDRALYAAKSGGKNRVVAYGA